MLVLSLARTFHFPRESAAHFQLALLVTKDSREHSLLLKPPSFFHSSSSFTLFTIAIRFTN